MNYSHVFRMSVDEFAYDPSPTVFVEDYDNLEVFCFIRTLGAYQPILFAVKNEERAKKVLVNPDNTIVIEKAEEIITKSEIYSTNPGRTVLQRVLLNEKIYYSTHGMIFNGDKVPIVLYCKVKLEDIYGVFCINPEIFKNQEEPLNRFIIRKLLPYFLENEKRFCFMNCSAFILKPTFQGRLDKDLVGKFLSNRVKWDFTPESRPKVE